MIGKYSWEKVEKSKYPFMDRFRTHIGFVQLRAEEGPPNQQRTQQERHGIR